MGSNFHTLLLDGLFYLDGNNPPGLYVKPDDGEPTSVDEALQAIQGQPVKVTIHHSPTFPINPTKWGGGSCGWQESGECPFGHHRDPGRLFTVQGEGVLTHEAGTWWFERVQGGRESLPLANALNGHRGRILAVTLFQRDEQPASGDVDIEDLTHRAQHLHGILSDLKQFLGEK
jgi:hypothetical protein